MSYQKIGFKIQKMLSPIGSRKGKVGSQMVDITASFQRKIITTAEGGIATTNNKQLLKQAMRPYGITKDKERFISKDLVIALRHKI